MSDKHISFSLRIADRVFAVRAEYSALPDKYLDYVVNDNTTPDYHIEITAEEILAQSRLAVPEQDGTATRDFQKTGVKYPFSYLVQDRIFRLLLKEDVLYMHASALRFRGKAYVFAAPSGTGKSTHTGLWREEFKDDVVMINDDKIFMRLTDDGVIVYGTPWMGKHAIGQNISAPLGGICFLAQDKENTIRRLRPQEAFYHFYHQLYMGDHPDDQERVFSLAGRLMERVPIWFLRCTKSADAARLANDAMTR